MSCATVWNSHIRRREGEKFHQIDGDEEIEEKRESLTSNGLKNGNHAPPTAVVSSEK
jgi:hypothetical protein